MRRAGPSARGVTQAWAMAADLAGVRLLRGDGSRIDCFAARTDGRVLLLQPVRVASRHEDESTPLYTPPGRDPPRDGCVTTLPARVDARQVGWLSYPVCDQGDPPRQPPEGLAPIPPSV